MVHVSCKAWVCRWSAVCLLALAACEQGPGWANPELNFTEFKEDVYPVLIRDCAFQACHGAEGRFLRIWGPGRTRLDSTLNAFSEATNEEINRSYERAAAMVDHAEPSRSLLLRKALATEAGGAGHLGADKFGRNVYRTVDDEGYLKLSRWVYSGSK